MREQYAAEQDICIGSDGCHTGIDLNMFVTFTADVSENPETIEVTAITFYTVVKDGYRGEKVHLPSWVHDRYLSSPDFKDWLQSVAMKIEKRAAKDAELARALS